MKAKCFRMKIGERNYTKQMKPTSKLPQTKLNSREKH